MSMDCFMSQCLSRLGSCTTSLRWCLACIVACCIAARAGLSRDARTIKQIELVDNTGRLRAIISTFSGANNDVGTFKMFCEPFVVRLDPSTLAMQSSRPHVLRLSQGDGNAVFELGWPNANHLRIEAEPNNVNAYFKSNSGTLFAGFRDWTNAVGVARHQTVLALQDVPFVERCRVAIDNGLPMLSVADGTDHIWRAPINNE